MAREIGQTRVPEDSRANLSASPFEPNSHKTTVSVLLLVEVNRKGSMCRVFNQQRSFDILSTAVARTIQVRGAAGA